MRSRMSVVVLVLFAAAGRPSAQPVGELKIAHAGPVGEIATREQANEVRIVFSEPMVALGRIPQQVSPAFFKIVPAVPGTFRWAGTTTLIFAPAAPLPHATRYDVTIETSAVALSGRRLAAPYQFSFITPTVRLVEAEWYRRNGRYDAAVVIALRFNQSVRSSDVLSNVTARFQPHEFTPPAMAAAALERLRRVEPQALSRLDAKVAAASAAASAASAVPLVLAKDWDQKRFKPGRGLVVVETVKVPPPDSWIALTVGKLPGEEGRETPPVETTRVVELEPTFFVDDFKCTRACDPDSWNPVRFRREVKVDAARAAMTAVDITGPKEQTVARRGPPQVRSHELDSVTHLTLEDLDFERQPPARRYAVRVDGSLRAADGQPLGYTFIGLVENWHERAFTSFGDGHGVWEAGSDLQLPFHARNYQDVTQWAVPLAPPDLMPKMLELQQRNFRELPPGPGVHRKLVPKLDTIQSFGVDLSRAVKSRGLVWAGVRAGNAVTRSRPANPPGLRQSSTIVQVTNLGISVKDSPQNTLVLVTRLDNGEPVAGARVSIINRENKVFWQGATNRDGIVIAPNTPIRDPDLWRLSFVVTAEKDGDLAYVASDWNEGIHPWDFNTSVNLREAKPLLRGTVFTDRGVYRLGEEVHFKAVLREDTPAGIRLLNAGSRVEVTLSDSQGRELDTRTVTVGEWSSTEWTFRLPTEGSLGHYTLRAVADPVAPKKPTARGDRRGGDAEDRAEGRSVHGQFLVAAYRRPDFRVDANLSGDPAMAGAPLKAVVTARYLFGAPMMKRPVRWSYSRSPYFVPPRAVTERFPADRFEFVAHRDEDREQIASREAALDASGQFSIDLTTVKDAGIPYTYTFEGDVEDVSRQRLAGRASFVVHPAPWYIGIQRPPYFVEQPKGLATAFVAVVPDGRSVAGVRLEVTLTQVQWHSVRRAEGHGFYTWETQRKEVPAGAWALTSAMEPVPLHVPLTSGGYFVLRAKAADDEGRLTSSEISFYALGEGYTAWARYDHNRIDLVPERRTYKPGEQARIMIQSPWERATALVTTEREGITTHRPFQLTSTQQSITVPIGEADIPNVFVSVLLVKGRSKAAAGPSSEPDDTSDPGKPAFRLGYTELRVEDASKRLDVTVTANKEEYRPANAAKVDVAVKDQKGGPSAAEVTLWAVDYGVLSLTGFRTPDVGGSVYVPKSLQVMNSDSRQRIISRRVLVPKGTDEGGGGGVDGVAGAVRKDFRILAFWVGSVVTDAHGRATVDVKLPESLTTYRIMAVAGDKSSRFGSGESEIRVNKPVTLKPAFPRFLALGDRAAFGSIVASQLRQPGAALVTMRSLDPRLLEIGGQTTRTVNVPPGGSAEVRFDATARAVGRARVHMTVRLSDETDAFEDVVPVQILSTPETVTAYGEAAPDAREKFAVPPSVVPGYGGLRLELSSTAMAGLGEGARYLIEYPYGCAEQRASRTLALALATELGHAFSVPGFESAGGPAGLRDTVRTSLRELETFQCPSGAFSFWPGDCRFTSEYLTSYVLHVMQTARSLEYPVRSEILEAGYTYLAQRVKEGSGEGVPPNPYHLAWQAFAVKVLSEGRRAPDAAITRLYREIDRMPVFALAYLADAIAARGDVAGGPRAQALQQRLANAVLPEAGTAHVEELDDPHLFWCWSSNVQSTAAVLSTLVRHGSSERASAGQVSGIVRGMVRWLLSIRKDGRWSNTQENAWVLEALFGYYRRYETESPEFSAAVTLAGAEVARAAFKGRTTHAEVRTIPMADLQAKGRGDTRQLTFRRDGAGTLFYTARLRYASPGPHADALDGGFRIERRYAVASESGVEPPRTSFKAGDLVRVTLSIDVPKERRFVAVVDPLPAGFEPVESWFATTAADLTRDGRRRRTLEGDAEAREEDPLEDWWQRGGFDRVERHDDRVQLFGMRLSEGRHEFSYLARATTAGSFHVAPARVEEMYEPEVFGRTPSAVVEVKP